MLEFELIVLKGVNRGTKYPLNTPVITIGRSKDNDLVLEDELVSRRHCRLLWREYGYEIEDLGSTNKTVVNNEIVQLKLLEPGDKIQIGETVFLFTTRDEEGKFYQETVSEGGTKVITVTELKMRSDEHILLDITKYSDNIEELRKAYGILSNIYKIGVLINTMQDTAQLLNILADKLTEVLSPDRTVIMLFGDKDRGKIIRKVVRVTDSRFPGDTISMSMVHESLNEGVGILSYDALADERFRHKKSVILNKIRSAMCAPIRAKEAILGVIYVDTHIKAGKFSKYDLQFLTIVGNEAGVAIQNARLYEDLDLLFTGALKTLIATVEAKDPVTSGHSLRVTVFSLAIGEELGLTKGQLRILKISALLHDIGKVGIPESILGKPAPLSSDEYTRMQEHPARGAEIVKNIKYIEEVVSGIRYHHERYDGKGFPEGLKGNQIPLISRIICVADSFDAILYDRPYRKGIPIEEAVKEILRCKGTQFDPEVVDAFLSAYKRGKISKENVRFMF